MKNKKLTKYQKIVLGYYAFMILVGIVVMYNVIKDWKDNEMVRYSEEIPKTLIETEPDFRGGISYRDNHYISYRSRLILDSLNKSTLGNNRQCNYCSDQCILGDFPLPFYVWKEGNSAVLHVNKDGCHLRFQLTFEFNQK